jgi:hypothetical protein
LRGDSRYKLGDKKSKWRGAIAALHPREDKIMDITRNWRLKTSRSQLLATRCPVTGAVVLAQQTGIASTQQDEIYVFDTPVQTRVADVETDYAKAAR